MSTHEQDDDTPSFAGRQVKWMIGAFVCLASCLVSAAPPIFHGSGAPSGQTYYVATTGNNSNPGTIGSPWLTISKATTIAGAKDTVYLRGGVYTEEVTIARGGRYESYPAETAIVDGTGVTTVTGDEGLVTISGSGTTLRRIEIRNSLAHGVRTEGEFSRLVLDDLYVHDNIRSGIFADGPQTTAAFASITESEVSANGRGGITLWGVPSGYWRLENNDVHNNTGASNYDGIQIGGASLATHHVVVRNNRIVDNGSANAGEDNLDLGGHAANDHYLVEGNDIRGSIGRIKLHSGDAITSGYATHPSHIFRRNRITGLGWTTYGFPNPIAVYNNTFFDCGSSGECIQWYWDRTENVSLGDATYSSGSDTGRMNWKNNVFFQNAATTTYALLVNQASSGVINITYSSLRLQNNFYRFDLSGQRLTWAGVFYSAPVTSVSFLMYQALNSPNFPDTGSIYSTATSAATFTAAGSYDYTPASGSPLVDTGMALTTTVGSGTSSTTLIVDRASYFQDGYCVGSACLGVPDSIRINGGSSIAIAPGGINDSTNTITLATPATWSSGQAVTLGYNGSAVDIGAVER